MDGSGAGHEVRQRSAGEVRQVATTGTDASRSREKRHDSRTRKATTATAIVRSFGMNMAEAQLTVFEILGREVVAL